MHIDLAAKILLASALGALLELDEYFIGMTLVSQPIIAGGIAGLIFGDPGTGIMIGSIVQLIWLMPPVGAYVPPSPSAIAFTAAGIGIMMESVVPAGERNSFLMFAMILGASFGYFTGQMDIWNRKLNTRIMRRFEAKVEEGREAYAYLIQALAILAKYLRDVAGYLAIFVLGVPLAIRIYSTLPVEVDAGLKIAFWAAPMIGFAVLFDMFRTKAGGVFHGTVLVLSYALFSAYNLNLAFFLLMLFTAGVLIVYDRVWNRRGA
jgi:mannose/fructose/N-acetylgalactosamine-specific phosphotransferase system component IIC